MHNRRRDRREQETFEWNARCNWVRDSGMAFVAETGSGHMLTMDGAPDGGGRNLAPRPMETVLAGTGGCTAYDVVLILQRGRHDVRGCTVKVRPSARRPTRRCSRASTCISWSAGAKLTEAPWRGRSALSHEKYCSATVMLAKTAEITTATRSLRLEPRHGWPSRAHARAAQT